MYREKKKKKKKEWENVSFSHYASPDIIPLLYDSVEKISSDNCKRKFEIVQYRSIAGIK